MIAQEMGQLDVNLMAPQAAVQPPLREERTSHNVFWRAFLFIIYNGTQI